MLDVVLCPTNQGHRLRLLPNYADRRQPGEDGVSLHRAARLEARKCSSPGKQQNRPIVVLWKLHLTLFCQASSCGSLLLCGFLPLQVGIFQTLFLNASPADAYSRLAAGAPYETFRDASTGESMLPLTVLHVIEVSARCDDTTYVQINQEFPSCCNLQMSYTAGPSMPNGIVTRNDAHLAVCLSIRPCTLPRRWAFCRGRATLRPLTWRHTSITSRYLTLIHIVWTAELHKYMSRI